jgi:hypothetical protein
MQLVYLTVGIYTFILFSINDETTWPTPLKPEASIAAMNTDQSPIPSFQENNTS